jgi:hypothetical protein
MKEETGIKMPQTKEYMESPEAGRGKESHDLSLEHSERP